MADRPDYLVLQRHRDLVGRRQEHWVRRVLVAVLAAFLILGLVNVFGQRPATSTAASPEAELEVYAPAHVRGGLYYEARFTIEARRELRQATLVLDPGWAEGLTINTIEPAPVAEASRDGKLVLELGHVPRGQKHVLYVQQQVNPTNVGRRSQDVSLYDGGRRLLEVSRSITVFP
jgi:hypothetical protein